MAREPKGYWEKRSTELLKNIEQQTLYTINDLIKAYNKATIDINKEIKKIYNKYTTDNKLNKKEAMTLLSKKENDKFYKELLEKINNITDEEIKKKLLAKYNAPAYAYRITRYQALQENIDVELKKLASIEKEISKIRYVDTITEGFYRNIFNIQKGLGVGFNFSQIDKKTINLMLNNKWNKYNYSERIWNNSEKLSDYLKNSMIANILTGKSVKKMSTELNQVMEVGLYNATRLVRTETNYFANQAEMLAYEECGIEKYQFIATLDHVTCEHCAELDKRIFKVKEAKAGKNCPPIHPNDRCTTIAYFADEEELKYNLGRRARDEIGNSILVPKNMNYKQWLQKYYSFSENGDMLNNETNLEEFGKTKKLSSKILKICDELYKKFKENGYENLALVNSNTFELIGKISTNRLVNNVDFSLEQQNKMMLERDRTLLAIHNHPSNSTFSPHDIFKFIGNKKICGIIVSTEKFNYFLDADIESLEKARKNIEKFKKFFNDTLNNEIINITERGIKVDNEQISNIYKKIFDTIGWNYGRKKR